MYSRTSLSAITPKREERKKQIIKITNQGMDGSISFRESLEKD